MLEELWLIPLGFVAGILGSIVGFGGGTIIVPILTFVGFSPTLAVSNSLFLRSVIQSHLQLCMLNKNGLNFHSVGNLG